MLHLLVLSHVFVVPALKQICIQQLEHGFLTSENAVDIFQLALLCDAPRLSLICHRMILKNFQEISITEGWKVMKKSHPSLEKELLESLDDEENVRNLFSVQYLWPLMFKAANLMVQIICRCKGKELENQMRERSISNYTKQWRLLFIYAEMVVRQLGLMIKISGIIRHPATIQHAKDSK